MGYGQPTVSEQALSERERYVLVEALRSAAGIGGGSIHTDDEFGLSAQHKRAVARDLYFRFSK